MGCSISQNPKLSDSQVKNPVVSSLHCQQEQPSNKESTPSKSIKTSNMSNPRTLLKKNSRASTNVLSKTSSSKELKNSGLKLNLKSDTKISCPREDTFIDLSSITAEDLFKKEVVEDELLSTIRSQPESPLVSS